MCDIDYTEACEIIKCKELILNDIGHKPYRECKLGCNPNLLNNFDDKCPNVTDVIAVSLRLKSYDKAANF